MRPLIANAHADIGGSVGERDETSQVVQRIEHRTVLYFVAAGSRRKAEIPALREAVVAIVPLELQPDPVAKAIPQGDHDRRPNARAQFGIRRGSHSVDKMFVHQTISPGTETDIQPSDRWRIG